MPNTSRYDALHDKYSQLASSKSGTRYERLAALVLKALNESGVVIHDLKLAGDSDVPHQIDVNVEVDGKAKHLIVECKDFDVSGNKVGLNIVRSFWAVVDDTGADESWIITCNGFTKGAQKYAKHKGIKLLIIRTYDENKDGQYISTIKVNLTYITRGQPIVNLSLPNELAVAKFNEDLNAAGLSASLIKGDPVYINTPSSKVLFHDFVDLKLREHDARQDGVVKLNVDVSNITIEIENRGPLPISDLSAEYEVFHLDDSVVVASNLFAELVVQGLSNDDLFVFDEDLTRYQINPETGEVIRSAV